jgi:hypothetical protein
MEDTLEEVFTSNKRPTADNKSANTRDAGNVCLDHMRHSNIRGLEW